MSDGKSAKVISLASRRAPKPYLARSVCERIAAARQQAGMTRAVFAAALQSLLRWTPPITGELVNEWETSAPPPMQVVVTSETIAAHGGRPSGGAVPGHPLAHDLLLKDILDRDDLDKLSAVFDGAVANAAADEIGRLTHLWLIADTPQSIELRAGRRIGNQLIAAAEHRVVQLRRADDFVPGRRSVALVRKELQATLLLLREASASERQVRQLLTVLGELSQLAAWVAADAGNDAEAARYVQGGVVAARAGGDASLAANIISTLSYQIANTGDPRVAAILARTAYAGARHHATPAVKALLLERVAWADARSGDRRSCERSLGRVEDQFARAPSPGDPDWVYWLNREEVDVMAGRCYTELHRPDRAEPLLRRAIEHYDRSLIRENSLYLSWLAEDYVQLGEIAHAAEVAKHIALLAGRADSARTDTRLRHLVGLLKPHKAVQEVADFLEFYCTLAG